MLLSFQHCRRSFPSPKSSLLALLALVLLALTAGACSHATREAAPAVRAPTAPVSDAGATACANGAFICEDFETGRLDPARWMTKEKLGTVRVDTMHAHGRYAMHAHLDNKVGSIQNRAYLRPTQKIPLGETPLFIRAFVYLEPSLPDRHFEPFRIWDTQSELANAVNLETRVKDGVPTSIFRMTWDHGKQEPKARQSSETAVLGKWTCWELEYRGATHEMFFSVDGKDVPGMHIDPAMEWKPPAIALVDLGNYAYHTDEHHPDGFDLWMDDIAISRTKVGCGP